VNLVLFDKAEIEHELPLQDRRVKHIKTVLRLKEGDSFRCAVIGGPIGRAEIITIQNTMSIIFHAESKPTEAAGIDIILGMTRPIHMKRMLKDLAAFRIRKVYCCGTELGEKSYVQSNLWKQGAFRKFLIEGAEQGNSSWLPQVKTFYSLKQALSPLCQSGDRFYFHNSPEEQAIHLLDPGSITAPVTLALGSERGWTARELDLLRSNSFQGVHMGEPVLKTETALVAAISIFRMKMALP
jgi:16S rRNA (uracil1498-N3)-methyltransferase